MKIFVFLLICAPIYANFCECLKCSKNLQKVPSCSILEETPSSKKLEISSRSKRNIHSDIFKIFMHMWPNFIHPLRKSYHNIKKMKNHHQFGKFVKHAPPKSQILTPSARFIQSRNFQEDVAKNSVLQQLHKSLYPQPSVETTTKKSLFNVMKQPKIGVLQAVSEKKNPKATEAELLRKLKRLNNKPFSTDLEDQATKFVQTCMHPRKKRTIIVGSDEIDFPPRYKVDLVSAENDYHQLPEEEPEDVQYYDIHDPILESPSPSFSWAQKFQKPAEVFVGKNVIQKAVREELNNFHKKKEREQKIKDIKGNLLNKHNNGVPQNPIFLLLTAPMQFLKHFSDLNKGATPVMSSLPKLVHTAKRCFIDFGKNFHKHCLNLASNVIGDFDHVHPNVIEKMIDDNNGRFKRNAELKNNSKIPKEKSENFPKVQTEHVRKKRYVVKIVDNEEMHQEVQHYLTEKLDDKFSFLQPIQDYYNKIADFFTKPLSAEEGPDEAEDFVKSATPKKIVIKKLKPRIIIDNKGLPFMEFDGYKRPLLLRTRGKTPVRTKKESSEETGDRISSLITRAKENSEVVGSIQKDFLPIQVVKERISTLLRETDELVHINAEDFDQIFENLIKLQQIKSSIEQDWKRLLMDNKIDDMQAKIGLLGKFSDLQQTKDETLKKIATKLEEIDNEFVRAQLIKILIRLQKLQCIISNVVEDVEQHLETRTSFILKKEIKYVDYLSGLKFVQTKSRNDLVKKFDEDRHAQGQRNMEILKKLKKILAAESKTESFDNIANLLWELKNLKKLQMQTSKEMNKKLKKRFKVKKELKILFDLQKRFEDCEEELAQKLGNENGKEKLIISNNKKDVKEILAQIKQKHEELLQKAKEKNLQRLKM